MKAKDAKRILQCSYTTLHNYVKSGIIRAIKNPINNYLIFDDASVIDLASKIKYQNDKNIVSLKINGDQYDFSNVSVDYIRKIVNFLKERYDKNEIT